MDKNAEKPLFVGKICVYFFAKKMRETWHGECKLEGILPPSLKNVFRFCLTKPRFYVNI